MPDANLTRSVMHFFDCFMDDFYDENYIHTLSDLDIRGQVEVTFSYSHWRTLRYSSRGQEEYYFIYRLSIGLFLIFLRLGDGRNADGKLSGVVQRTF